MGGPLAFIFIARIWYFEHIEETECHNTFKYLKGITPQPRILDKNRNT